MKTRFESTKPATRLRKRQRGFAFIEVLVASLIFAFGVLGIVGLQARMSSAQSLATMRLTAINLTQEVIGAMWADVSTGALGNFAAGACSGNSRCNAWNAKVASELPGGAQTIEVVGNTASIELTWQSKDGPQKYRTFTAVQP